tara:strand:- start:1289 stop:2281 length:993 start_codon:yes stop_codon:yes gene_type:complete
MKTFSKFIAESRMTTHDEIVKAIAAYKNAGEILNPAYKDLIDQAKRIMRVGSSFSNKPDSLLDLVRSEQDDRDPDLNDLYYTSFDGFASHGKIEKLVTKLEKKNKPQYKTALKDVREYLKDWKPVGEDLKALKSKVVKVSTRRAEVKAASTAAMARKFADSSSLIKIFESHLNEYKHVAEQRAREFVKGRLEFLKKHDWDIDKAAPRSSYNNYKMVQQTRATLSSLTKSKKSSLMRGEPDIRIPDNTKIEHFVKLNVQSAEEAYRDFMQKMIGKIGKPVIDAKMTGSIWTNALLTVTTDDGDQQVWNTKMILNFSKYQKMFNQFPSRRKS